MIVFLSLIGSTFMAEPFTGWLSSIVLAIGFAIALHQLSLIDPPVSTGLHDLSKVVLIQAARVFGLIGQYIVPGALLFGALAGFIQRRRGKDLLTQTRTKTNGLATLSWQQFEQLVGAILREQEYRKNKRRFSPSPATVDRE